MFKKILLSLLLLIIFITVGSYFYLSKIYPNISPFLTGTYYIQSWMNPHVKLDKHVMGFLPFWRVDDIGSLKLHLISEVNYFSISPTADGSLAKVVNGETDPGFREWDTSAVQNFKTKTQIMGTDFTVTIAALNNNLIESILTSPTAKTTLIAQIVDFIKTNNLDGVNIDFEYSGEPDPALQEGFTDFSKQLAANMEKETPDAHLSMSSMPRAARDPDIYDYQALVPLYDRFIVMSYDYYGQGSDIAGPVAPMKGFKDNKYFFDVETTYEDYLKYIPAEKIVMGIPYYGWDRAVEDGKTINSLTYPSDHANNYTAVISYARAREERLLNPKQCKWDDIAKETWCWYTKGGVDHQVWIADNKSVQTRFDYASKQKLGGIGIWVVGYDKGYPDLWNMIEKKFTVQ